MELVGFHCHVGSQVFAEDVFERAAVIMLEFAAHMEKAHGYQTRQLDLGGGYGVRYVECDPVLDVDAKVAQVAAAAKGACARLGIALPEIHMEPGCSIVGDAGLTLYTVGTVKESPAIKTTSRWTAACPTIPASPSTGPATPACWPTSWIKPAEFPCSVVGRCCESGDIIQEHVLALPGSVGRGDILAGYARTAPTTTHGLQLQPPSQAPPLSCSGAATSPMWQSAGSPWRIGAATTCKNAEGEWPHQAPLPSCLSKTHFRHI